MASSFFDTVILIDALKGLPQALELLDRSTHRSISRISWMEVLCGAKTKHQEELFIDFLTYFEIVEITERISLNAVRLRKAERLKLPDAIILASALEMGQCLLTCNTKDFSSKDPRVLIPYRID